MSWRNQSTANIALKGGLFGRPAETSQLDVGVGKGRFRNVVKVTEKLEPDGEMGTKSRGTLYKSVPARVRSIRRADDNILKKPQNFDEEYGE